jgi:hypothetical protein
LQRWAGMFRLSMVVLAASVPALAACATIQRVPTCGLGEPQPIGFDQVLPDGTTARAFSERLAGSHRGTLEWFPSSESDLEITVPAPLATTTVDLEVGAPATSATYRPAVTPPELLLGTTCPGAIELAVALRVATADGGLDEHWTATATQGPGGGVSFAADLAQQPLAGTLRVVQTDAAAWDETTFAFETTLDASGAGSGSVYYSASRETNGLYEGFGVSAALFTFWAPDAGVTAPPDAGGS